MRWAELDDYNFGYNGMLKDDDIMATTTKSGEGNAYSTLYRGYNSRFGRWFSIDPLAAEFAWSSPYVGMGANPVIFVDPFGLAQTDPNETHGKPENPDDILDHEGSSFRWSEKFDKWLNLPQDLADERKYDKMLDEFDIVSDFLNSSNANAGIYFGIKEYSNVLNNKWQGINGKWYSLDNEKFFGNQHTSSKYNTIKRAGTFRTLGRISYGLSVGESVVSLRDNILAKDYNSAIFNFADLGVATIGTFTGPYGFGFSVVYFSLRGIDESNRNAIFNHNDHKNVILPDNTNVKKYFQEETQEETK